MEETRHDTTLWQDLRSLSGQYWILFGGTLVNRFGNFVMPFMTFYLRHERDIGRGDYPEWKIAVVLGSYGAGALLAGLVGGYLSDRFGRKPVMVFSCFGGAAFMLLLSQAHGMAQLMACIFAMAFVTALYYPAASALIADLVPPQLRVRAYSCQRLAVNLGFATGMACAGFMARHSFAWLFILDALTTIVLGCVVLWGLEPRRIPAASNNSWSHALGHMKGNRNFKFAAVAAFLIAMVFNQIGSSYSLQATVTAHLEASVYGYLLALNGVMVGCLELPLTNFTRRFSPSHMMAAGYAIVGLGLGLNAFGATIAILVASMLILTFGEMLALPISSSYLAGLAPDDMRGRYQGVISTTGSLASMLGPPLGLVLYGYSPMAVWVLVLVLSGISAALMLATAERKARAAPASDVP